MFKLCEWRRKSRAQRLATANTDDAKVEEPYVDDVQEKPTETITTTEEEPPKATEKTQPIATDWIFFSLTFSAIKNNFRTTFDQKNAHKFFSFEDIQRFYSGVFFDRLLF